MRRWLVDNLTNPRPAILFQRCESAGVLNMTTGKKPASKAGKELANKKSTRDEKTVAGSDLAQAKRKPKKK
jgi:hypothetical protein